MRSCDDFGRVEQDSAQVRVSLQYACNESPTATADVHQFADARKAIRVDEGFNGGGSLIGHELIERGCSVLVASQMVEQCLSKSDLNARSTRSDDFKEITP